MDLDELGQRRVAYCPTLGNRASREVKCGVDYHELQDSSTEDEGVGISAARCFTVC